MSRPSSPPFDWMQPHRPAARARLDAERRTGMYRAEMEERAALLSRLGHDRESVRARLASNLSWDFPPGRRPLTDADLEGILDRVFAQPTPSPRANSKGAAR